MSKINDLDKKEFWKWKWKRIACISFYTFPAAPVTISLQNKSVICSNKCCSRATVKFIKLHNKIIVNSCKQHSASACRLGLYLSTVKLSQSKHEHALQRDSIHEHPWWLRWSPPGCSYNEASHQIINNMPCRTQHN